MDTLTRLAENARAGNKASLDDFVEATYEQVWRLCATLVDRQSAGDLAQKTFIRAVGAVTPVAFRATPTRSLPARSARSSSSRIWSLGTVRSRVARARSDLLRHLDEREQRRAL
ncbi:MAG: hypothetical protein ACYCST_10940 [Acidimicrobiales bacterium]